MMEQMMEITSYRVFLLGARRGEVNYGNLGRCWTTAQISLEGPGDTDRASLIFYDPLQTKEVPTSRFKNPEGHKVLVFIPKDQYAFHLDLLRNESPIFLVDDGNLWYRGRLGTTMEAVGEGDL